MREEVWHVRFTRINWSFCDRIVNAPDANRIYAYLVSRFSFLLICTLTAVPVFPPRTSRVEELRIHVSDTWRMAVEGCQKAYDPIYVQGGYARTWNLLHMSGLARKLLEATHDGWHTSGRSRVAVRVGMLPFLKQLLRLSQQDLLDKLGQRMLF